MNVTMKDIAQELGISIGTVSKVLRDHPDISPETRERVRNPRLVVRESSARR